MRPEWNRDSFGDRVPSNWQLLCHLANEIIYELPIEEADEAADSLWADFDRFGCVRGVQARYDDED